MEQKMKTWICVVCGFVYDEAAGLPDDGIAPGTRWADVPADWACRLRRGQGRLRDGRSLIAPRSVR
jgi:rubredoxin